MSLDFNHLEECFGFALDNIAKNGDTDIFLFPYETRMFEDEREKLIKSLMDTYINFSDRVEESSPINISTFSTVGYLGYRWVTQIDPYWNVFFLGLILNLSSKIEQQRKNTDCVYSYRIQPDEELKSIFNKEIGWRNYQEKSIEYCNSNENVNYILSCDIADFYTRVYHHPLENALQRIDEPSYDKAKKIMSLLQKFSKMTSYGLPVGGAASRILAELALNKIDNLLAIRGIKFKRFVDDYYIFCNSSGEARIKLGELSTLLMQNLGLTIQKHKTNIYSKEEFIAITEAKLYGSERGDGDIDQNRKRFMSLDITYDPYSQNADDNYDTLKRELQGFDLLGLLGEEINKSRINQSLSKKIIRSLAILDNELLSKATIVVFDNLEILYPIYINLVQTILSNWKRLSSDAINHLYLKLYELIKERSYIIENEVNASYTIKLLSKENNETNQYYLLEVHRLQSDSLLIGQYVFQVMAKWNNTDWLSNEIKKFSTMNQLHRRLAILSSYLLGDEGQHWRQHHKKQFNFLENIYKDWGAFRKIQNNLGNAL